MWCALVALSIVTAKTGLLRLYRKDTISKVFPLNSRNIQIGDITPSKKHALWVHFGGLLQLPVPWHNLHRGCVEYLQLWRFGHIHFGERAANAVKVLRSVHSKGGIYAREVLPSEIIGSVTKRKIRHIKFDMKSTQSKILQPTDSEILV